MDNEQEFKLALHRVGIVGLVQQLILDIFQERKHIASPEWQKSEMKKLYPAIKSGYIKKLEIMYIKICKEQTR